MNKEDLWGIYDNNYASDYNERYLLNPFSKVSSGIELGVLKTIINDRTKWLDLGCGTGYFLSEFPGVQRAGLDVSPEMLKMAAIANPDALFFKEADFREDRIEWHNTWSLITCMWGAYCYVDSITEVEKVIANMVKWTQTGGAIFLPVVDLEDVRPNNQTPYELNIDVFGGRIALTSVTWTWEEHGNGKVHQNLVSPHAEHLIKLMRPFFDNIELIRYPPYMEGWVSRKAILATGKRDSKDEMNPAKLTWSPVPEPINKSPKPETSLVQPLVATEPQIGNVSTKGLIVEVFKRLRLILLRKKRN